MKKRNDGKIFDPDEPSSNHFSGYSTTISIDGGTARDEYSRFCLGCIPNINRNVLGKAEKF